MPIKKITQITFIMLTAIQLILAVMWVASNITVIPDLDVCHDYMLGASRNVTDEYMSFFYMKFVRFILLHTSGTATFAVLLYLFQMLIVTGMVFVFARSISEDIFKDIVVTVFIVTNPFVLSSIMQVSPYAIRFGILLLIISIGVDIAYLRERQIYGNAFGHIVKWLIFLALVAAFTFANNKLADSGSFGRCENRFINYEMQRFVWPHLGEITYTYVLEQTDFDTSQVPNNYLSSEYLWSGFIPDLYEHYGDYAYEVLKRYVKEFGFTARTKENMVEWVKDILSYFCAPYTIMLNMKGAGYSHTGEMYNSFISRGAASSIYWSFSCMFSLVWSIYGVVMAVVGGFVNKARHFTNRPIFFNRFTVSSLIIMFLISLYNSFFLLRGFNYSYGLWMIVLWPLIFLHAFTSDDFR